MGYGFDALASLEGQVIALAVVTAFLTFWLLWLTFKFFGCKKERIQEFFEIRCTAQTPVAVLLPNQIPSDSEGDVFFDSLDSIA